jgi:4-hydroxybenzoate polyprenyltransferase
MSMIKAWAQLLRIPNVFTALADVIAGALLALGRWPEGDEVLTLIRVCFASACLYSAGMVLNDFFDVAEDTCDRPFRPIPSGRVKQKVAGVAGFALLVIGLLLGLSGIPSTTLHSTNLIAPVLAAMILLYDSWLKRTSLGPLAMGSCRSLNVLLGGTSLASSGQPLTPLIFGAAVVGIYVCGLTYLAKRETAIDQAAGLEKKRIIPASGPILILITFLALPFFNAQYDYSERMNRVLLALLEWSWIVIIAIVVLRALKNSDPPSIQIAVKSCIFGLVGLDSIFACAAVGLSGLLLLLLLIPSIILGRFIYST